MLLVSLGMTIWLVAGKVEEKGKTEFLCLPSTYFNEVSAIFVQKRNLS